MGNLDTLLKRDISVPPCVRLELVLGVAKGLEGMHGAGWAHLDLKEHNVMVCHSMDEAAEQSRRPRLLAKLCDFGSALYLPEPAVLTLPEDDMGIRYGCGTAGAMLGPARYLVGMAPFRSLEQVLFSLSPHSSHMSHPILPI